MLAQAYRAAAEAEDLIAAWAIDNKLEEIEEEILRRELDPLYGEEPYDRTKRTLQAFKRRKAKK
ncbi:MAG: hypothetical protein GXO39_04375 [Thermotogae bacterium]|nr:hypothetical protein [Thermotogota bacterium]